MPALNPQDFARASRIAQSATSILRFFPLGLSFVFFATGAIKLITVFKLNKHAELAISDTMKAWIQGADLKESYSGIWVISVDSLSSAVLLFALGSAFIFVYFYFGFIGRLCKAAVDGASNNKEN